jgi:hypothetical protein
MRSRPTFPTEIRARIEQERAKIFEDSKRFNLLFLPVRTAFQSIVELGSQTTAPRQVMSATMESQIADFTGSLFDAEARHLVAYGTDVDTFRLWIDELANDVEKMAAQQVADERHNFHCSAEERNKFITDVLSQRGTYWTDQNKAMLARIAQGPRREAAAPVPVRNRRLFYDPPSNPPSNPPAEIVQTDPAPNEEVQRRRKLLDEYKNATGRPSNRKIYTSANSGIHKPQFHKWLKGELQATSKTSIQFERFLRGKKRPIPRA